MCKLGRKIDVEDLVGSAEIASRLGLSQVENVHTWRNRHADFPQPLTVIGRAMIWSWRDVELWARETGRL